MLTAPAKNVEMGMSGEGRCRRSMDDERRNNLNLEDSHI
jgi:hypothetical protein